MREISTQIIFLKELPAPLSSAQIYLFGRTILSSKIKGLGGYA
jgi:hypothetical protein